MEELTKLHELHNLFVELYNKELIGLDREGVQINENLFVKIANELKVPLNSKPNGQYRELWFNDGDIS